MFGRALDISKDVSARKSEIMFTMVGKNRETFLISFNESVSKLDLLFSHTKNNCATD